jgi:hypothetical protein
MILKKRRLLFHVIEFFNLALHSLRRTLGMNFFESLLLILFSDMLTFFISKHVARLAGFVFCASDIVKAVLRLLPLKFIQCGC